MGNFFKLGQNLFINVIHLKETKEKSSLNRKKKNTAEKTANQIRNDVNLIIVRGNTLDEEIIYFCRILAKQRNLTSKQM